MPPSSTAHFDVGLDLALALTAERGWPTEWRPAPQHSGLACAVIDAVMTPHVRTDTVAAVVRRYLRLHSPHDGPAELSRSFDLYGPRWPEVIGTHNRAWRSADAPLKSEVIAQAADLLVGQGVTTCAALHARAVDAEMRHAWVELPGQASGATWRHLLLVSGYHTPMVCPLTRSFIRRHIPFVADSATHAEILELMAEVARTLGVPVLDVDHQMWRAAARGRPRAAQTLVAVAA